MQGLDEIKEAVSRLPSSEQNALREWLGHVVRPAPTGRDRELAAKKLSRQLDQLASSVSPDADYEDLDAALDEGARHARRVR